MDKLTNFGNLMIVLVLIMAIIIGVAIFEYISLWHKQEATHSKYLKCMLKDVRSKK